MLVEGDWLTDSVINAVQTLLKKSFPHVGGLQRTTLAETLGFAIERGEFIQILHVSNNHWLTVSNIGCSQGYVNVYDSIPSGNIPERTKRQIAAILYTKEKQINIHFPSVQVQYGVNDCGLFALAFAATLCKGQDPSKVNYVQHELRKHLLHCINDQVIHDFPQRRSKKRAHLLGHICFSIYCRCSQPACGKMIQCIGCNEGIIKIAYPYRSCLEG